MQTGMKVSSILICAIFLFPIASQGTAQNAPNELIKAADQGLGSFLDRIPQAAMEEFGFSKDADLNQAYLGSPFPLYTITPGAIFKYRSGDTVGSITSKTNLWYFPVVLRNEVKAILAVDWIDNRWKAVSFSYAELARKLSKLRRQWPKSKGYNPQLIAVFQAKEYLFTVPEKDAYNLTSLESVKLRRIPPETFPDYSRLERFPTVIERLKPLVQKNIRAK